MMNLLGLVLICGNGLAAIYVAERIFKTRFGGWLTLGTCFPIGSVLVAMFLSILSIAGLQWNPVLSYLNAVTALGLGGMWFWSRRAALILHKEDKQLRFEVMGLAVIFAILWILMRSTELTHEFVHSDALNYWFLRANIFFYDKGVNLNSLQHLPFTTVVENPQGADLKPFTFLPLQYPLLVPLVIDYVYNLFGHIAIIPAKYLWLGVEWSISLLLYGVGREVFPKKPWHRFIPVVLFYLIPNTARRFDVHNFGYADIWLGLFWLTAVWSTYLALTKKQTKYLFFAIVGVCGVLMSKIEGLAGLWLVLLLFFMLGKKRRYGGLFSLIVMTGLSLVWYVQSFGLPHTSYLSSALDDIFHLRMNFGQWPAIAIAFFQQLGRISDYGIIWWAFFLVLAYYIKIQWKQPVLIWLWLSICAGMGVTLFEFLTVDFGYPTVSWVLPEALGRYAIQWYPTAIAFIFIVYSNLLAVRPDKNERKHKMVR